MISTRIVDRKTVYALAGESIIAVRKLDWICNYGLCTKCRKRVCVHKEFVNEFPNLLGNPAVEIHNYLQMILFKDVRITNLFVKNFFRTRK